MENYKHYTVLKETLKIISESHKMWLSNHGPFASNLTEDIEENSRMENIFVKEIALSFFTEYHQYYKTDYFFGCSFDVYKKTYKDRLENYKNEFLDTDEISFITDELDEGIYNYKFKEFNSGYFDKITILRYEKIKKQINHSLTKRFEYLSQKTKENGYDLVYNKSSETYSLESNSTINETKPPKDLDYLKISVLIAQGELTMIKGGKYQYRGKNFNKQDITKQLESDLKIKSVRQYIEGTFGADTDSTLSNDLFRNETKIKKTVEYCLFHNIQITKDYQSRFDNLELLH